MSGLTAGGGVRATSLGPAEIGKVCAVAGTLQRDMRAWAEEYPGLFSAKPFDAALYSTLTLASAFSGPWSRAADLRMANRACLWCFALDWLMDYLATGPEEVQETTRRCLAVAEGAPPGAGDDLARFLAEIRAELAELPAFAALGHVWREDLRHMLDAMTVELTWKAEGVVPDFTRYLDNADNLGFSFVFTTHWIATTSAAPSPEEIEAVRAASAAVQRVIRLLNDLGSHERDADWGDLNALMLGRDREQVLALSAELATRARELLDPVRACRPDLADYLERQMDFCAGFYQLADYWGRL
ncbi:terpene synthase family protein [Spongiactinospora rosea]|uniref:terpene synthase family protein n=1 Tax=Spongiactinospora rosea TaxID=2248750 RepID=UPI001CEC9D4D|nr:terpene synthase family protein [Spongiactinospora rosea]